MYAVLFEIDSMFGRHQYIFEGKTPEAIMTEFEYEQNLECLIRHGRYEEDAKGQLALDQLEAFYNKYVSGSITIEDIASLDVKISMGSIKCLAFAEGEEAVTVLKADDPNARMQ
jgi:hypothetical protein